MEKVIAIFDWWDGPLCGLAAFEGAVCIYERIFDEDRDDWSSEYYLTPIDDASADLLRKEWNIWHKKVQNGEYLDHCASDIKDLCRRIVEASPQKRAYKRTPFFYGRFEKGYIPTDYSVKWG